MKYRYLVVAIVTPLVFLLDQATKWWVMHAIPLGGGISVIPGYLDLIHARNTGAAFGMMADAHAGFRVPFFYIVAIVAVAVIALMLWRMREDERFMPIIFALILGGIAGNIVDRIVHGAVIDFISVHWRDAIVSFELFGRGWSFPLSWPAFNVADSAITVSMLLLLIAVFKKPHAGLT